MESGEFTVMLEALKNKEVNRQRAEKLLVPYIDYMLKYRPDMDNMFKVNAYCTNQLDFWGQGLRDGHIADTTFLFMEEMGFSTL
jgi:hypothetical protein